MKVIDNVLWNTIKRIFYSHNYQYVKDRFREEGYRVEEDDELFTTPKIDSIKLKQYIEDSSEAIKIDELCIRMIRQDNLLIEINKLERENN